MKTKLYALKTSAICKMVGVKVTLAEKRTKFRKDLGAKAPIVELLLLVLAAILIVAVAPNLNEMLDGLAGDAEERVTTGISLS